MLPAWSHLLWLAFAAATAIRLWLRDDGDYEAPPTWLKALAGLTLVLCLADGLAWQLGDASWQFLPALAGAVLALAMLSHDLAHRRDHHELTHHARTPEAESSQRSPTPADAETPWIGWLESWPHPTAIADSSGKVLWCNASWRDHHGLSAEEPVTEESPRSDWHELLPSAEARKAWQELVARAGEHGSSEALIERHGKEETWMAAATLVLAPGDDGLQWLTLTDVAEETFHVEARRMGHDLNNLLSAIIGNVGLAIDSPGVTPETQTDLREAEDASLRAAKVIQRLQSMSRGLS